MEKDRAKIRIDHQCYLLTVKNISLNVEIRRVTPSHKYSTKICL